jgi:hypothetical protein
MFHYKPSSYWGTLIEGNPHIIILQQPELNQVGMTFPPYRNKCPWDGIHQSRSHPTNLVHVSPIDHQLITILKAILGWVNTHNGIQNIQLAASTISGL